MVLGDIIAVLSEIPSEKLSKQEQAAIRESIVLLDALHQAAEQEEDHGTAALKRLIALAKEMTDAEYQALLDSCADMEPVEVVLTHHFLPNH